MDRHRLLTVLVAAVLMISAFITTVNADPVVIKDEEKGIGTETAERDRSLQDGTLIYSMTPVYPEDFDEGTYNVQTLSSSRFFTITDAELTNSGRSLRAVIRISSTSYAYIYPGTAAEAAAADQSDWIPADESSGFGEFTIDVEALNKEIPCAAYSKKKSKWYDRDIAFLAESIPADKLHVELSADGGTIADTQEAAMKVIYIALGIIIIGGILNHFVKRRFYE
ncbi:MAG: hypothetical protein IKE85_05605 [Mogibacterium sp.]|nr:hypothetical protein [Mogibacterium sp.]